MIQEFLRWPHIFSNILALTTDSHALRLFRMGQLNVSPHSCSVLTHNQQDINPALSLAISHRLLGITVQGSKNDRSNRYLPASNET